jgi:N-methylhydantoinase B
MDSANAPFDPVSLKIMWDRLVSLTDECLETMVRASFSTTVRECYDLSVTVMDRHGHFMAQGSQSIPSFTGSTPASLRHMLDRFPPETLEPGDVLCTNDPWMGTGHVFDLTVMRPVFRGTEIVAYTISISHLPDIGGVGYGTAGSEIYQEGLRLPVCKLVDAGTVSETLIDLLRYNTRVPEQVIGDFMANVNCNQIAGRELLAFMEEYDLHQLDDLSSAIRGQSEQAMRTKICALRDGVYQHSIQIEGFPDPITLACRIEIDGDSMHIDYDGTDDSVPRGINAPYCFTNSYSLYAVKCLVGLTIPNNQGMMAPITVTAPEGSCLNTLPPSPTGARHLTGYFCMPLIFGTLADAGPEQLQADSGMLNIFNVQGRHKDGRPVTALYFSSGGFGALNEHDGWPNTALPANVAIVPAEVWENITGMEVVCKRLQPDTGGPGTSRGGVGGETILRNSTGYPMTVFGMECRTVFPPVGMKGGLPGKFRKTRINGKPVIYRSSYQLEPGDMIELMECGGGGYGDPYARAPEKVLDDVRHGLVTSERALNDYGVDVDLESMTAERVRAAAE